MLSPDNSDLHLYECAKGIVDLDRDNARCFDGGMAELQLDGPQISGQRLCQRFAAKSALTSQVFELRNNGRSEQLHFKPNLAGYYWHWNSEPKQLETPFLTLREPQNLHNMHKDYPHFFVLPSRFRPTRLSRARWRQEVILINDFFFDDGNILPRGAV